MSKQTPRLNTAERIHFAILCRRTDRRFTEAAQSENVAAATRQLINATRLWNTADHSQDGDAMWRILDAYCGLWCLQDPENVNSILFTYADSIGVVKWAHTAAAMDNFRAHYCPQPQRDCRSHCYSVSPAAAKHLGSR